MTKLHVFDMDGTLLRGSACMELCRHVGRLDDVLEIEDAWGRGEVDHVEFYDVLLGMWHDLDDEAVPAIVCSSPWMDGIKTVCADILARGEHSCVISMSPQFFVDHLLGWGFEAGYGANVHPSRPLRSEDVLLPEGKVPLVESVMEQFALSESDVVAYGDSASDIPLFHRLQHTIAVNGTDRLRAIATASYTGQDLWGAYEVGRSLLDDGGSTSGARRVADRRVP